jgi:hypothetical protein
LYSCFASQWVPAADVNSKNSAGQTALLYALFSGYEGYTHAGEMEVLQLLLGAGANSDLADEQLHTPLHIASDERTVMAVEAGGETTLELLCRNVQTLEPKDHDGE